MRLIAILLLLVAPAAFAADATITWQHPTRNVDGSTIPTTGAGSVASTRLQYGSCSGTAFGTLLGELAVPGPATTAAVTALAAGTTVCFRAYSRNTYGEESGASNVVLRTIPAPVPLPPVLSSTVTVAWEYKRGWFGSRLEYAGTIPLGTPCGPKAYTIGTVRYNEVNWRAVDSAAKVRNTITICG
jgi:hypothetical protein